MTTLLTAINRTAQNRWLVWGAGALGVIGLALVLRCPTDVLEGGLGGALGAALTMIPGAPLAPPV